MRLTTGFTLNLGPAKLNADYSFCDKNVLTVGLGIGFGNKRNGAYDY